MFFAAKTVSGDEMGLTLSKLFSEKGTWEMIKIDGKCITFRGLDKRILDFLKVGLLRSNYTSRQQGFVERFLQTILIKILKFLDHQPDLSKWSSVLSKVEFAMNSLPHTALEGRTPFEASMRRPPVLLPAVPLPGSVERGDDEFQSLVKLADDVRAGALRTLISNKQYFLHTEGLKKGQCVWRKRQSFGRHMAAKLQVKVLHGYEVEERIGER